MKRVTNKPQRPTCDDLIRNWRTHSIHYYRAPEIVRVWGPYPRRMLLDVRRDDRRQNARLFANDYFRKALAHICASHASPYDAAESLYKWLQNAMWVLDSSHNDPHKFANNLSEAGRRKAAALAAIECAMSNLTGQYVVALDEIKQKIEEDALAGCGPMEAIYIALKDHFDPALLGRRGGAGRAAASDGAWRGWLVRQLDQLLPARMPKRYATIAGLLRHCGADISPLLVRSILFRGAT